MLSEDTRLVDKLWANVHYLNKGFMDMGFDIGNRNRNPNPNPNPNPNRNRNPNPNQATRRRRSSR